MVIGTTFLNEIDSLIAKDHEAHLRNKDLLNVFDILNLEKAENRTHSAFLAELLDPNGKHNMGDLFLRLFLETIDHQDKFSLDDVKVYKEYHLGIIDNVNKKGGRVDILLVNAVGQSICIENKIDAGLQKDQIERYNNFNSSKNHVCLLTLKGDLTVEFNSQYLYNWGQISYFYHIKVWLQKLLERVIDYPNLHEIIKQYLHLVNKLTGQLQSKTMNDELKSIIINNINASKQIAANYDIVLNELKESFRIKVYNNLSAKIASQNDWNVELGNAANQINSQIWVKYMKDDEKLWFGLEGFSGRGVFRNQLTMGIISIEKSVKEKVFREYINDNSTKSRNWWYEYLEVRNSQMHVLDFNDETFVAKLHNINFEDTQAEYVAEEFYRYFDQRKQAVIEILTSQI